MTPLVDLPTTKAHLNIPTSNTVDDTEIQNWINAATEIINAKCGYSASTSFTETVAGRADLSGRTTIVLARTPILSVQSITAQLQGLPTYDVSFVVDNPESGVIYLSNYWQFYGPLTVTYTAGRASIPAALQQACLLIVQDMWETQRGGALAAPGLGGGDNDPRDAGIPYRAEQLMKLAPYNTAPGIA